MESLVQRSSFCIDGSVFLEPRVEHFVSGTPAYDPHVKQKIGLHAEDDIVGFVYVGYPIAERPKLTARTHIDEVTRWEGKFKLSQNRSPRDRRRVRKALAARGTPDDLAVADLMAALEDDKAEA